MYLLIMCLSKSKPKEFFFLSLLGLRCCWGFSLVLVSRDHSLVAVWGLLIAVAALVAEHRVWGAWVAVSVAPGL